MLAVAWSTSAFGQTTISVLGSRPDPASPGVQFSPLDNPIVRGDFPLVAAPNDISPDGVMGTVMRAEWSWIHFRFDAFGNQSCSPSDLFCVPDDAFVAGNSTLPVAPQLPEELGMPQEWWSPTPLPYEIRGARIGREPATINLKWERQDDSTVTAASIDVALDPETFLVPVNVAVILPSAEFTFERGVMQKYTKESVFRALFDDQHTTDHFRAPSAVYEGYWNWLSRSTDISPNDPFGFRYVESLATSQDEVDRTRYDELGYQPDSVFAQCGIQFRMADFAVVEDANPRHVRFTDNGLTSGVPLCVDGATLNISAILRSFATLAAPSFRDPTLPTVVITYRLQGDLCPSEAGGLTLTDEVAAVAMNLGPDPHVLPHELGHLMGMDHIADPTHCTTENGIAIRQSLMCAQPRSPHIAGCEFREGAPVTPSMNCDPRNDLVARGSCDTARQHLGQKMDPSPPLLELGPDQVLECTSPAGATATVTAMTSDPETGVSSVAWTVDGTASPNIGTTLTLNVPIGAPVAVGAQATNGVGRSVFDQVTINVVDQQPPTFPVLTELTVDACDPALPVTVPVPGAADVCTEGPVPVEGVVVQTGGVALPTPIPVTNGQASVPPGVHVIEWTARDALGNTTTVTQTLSAAACVGAGRSLRVADRARFRAASGAPAPLVNHGSGLVDIGVEAETGSVISGGSMVLRDRATVRGSVRLQGELTRLNQTTITGSIVTGAPVSLPPPPTINGPWPPASEPGFSVDPDTSRNLVPGTFGTVSVKSRATLVLSAGTYYFDALHLEPQSRVKVDPATVIELRSGFTHRGAFVESTATGAPVANATVRYRGALPVFLENSFLGSLLAPNATLTLGGVNGAQFEGRFFARDLELRPDVIIVTRNTLSRPTWGELDANTELGHVASELAVAPTIDSPLNDEAEGVTGPEYTCTVSATPGAGRRAGLGAFAFMIPWLVLRGRRRMRRVAP